MNAKRDNNRTTVGLVATNDSNAETRPLLVDPTTGRLLIKITPVTEPTHVLNTGKIDGNRTKTAKGVTDDANLTPTPLHMDNRNNYLFCDVLEE